jgi:predicted DNA-binding transcriptional regulator YafY
MSNPNYNQIAFALEILRLLAEKPRKRKELEELLSIYLENSGKSADGDIKQKLTRTIRKLRDCGFHIDSSTRSPYQLIESKFPVILSTEQRQALAIAADVLSGMGFSAQASQIQRIGNLTELDIPEFFHVDFNPPVNYSDRNLNNIVSQLQTRFQQQCRYTILYESKSGKRSIWDLDKSELRVHDGTLYLFAFIPDWKSYRFKGINIDQNHIFRIDRIVNIGVASNITWFYREFPTLKVTYRTTGALFNYTPRRQGEKVIYRDTQGKYSDIEATIDYWFWFRQTILKYGANAQILDPPVLAEEIKKEYQKVCQNL